MLIKIAIFGSFVVRAVGCSCCAALSWILIALLGNCDIPSAIEFPSRDTLQEFISIVNLPNEDNLHAYMSLLVVAAAGAKFVSAYLQGPFDTAALTLEVVECELLLIVSSLFQGLRSENQGTLFSYKKE